MLTTQVMIRFRDKLDVSNFIKPHFLDEATVIKDSQRIRANMNFIAINPKGSFVNFTPRDAVFYLLSTHYKLLDLSTSPI